MSAFVKRRVSGRLALALLTGSVLLGLMSLVMFSLHSSGDYNVAGPVGGNNAAPAIMALIHGSLPGYVEHQPIVGLTSILLRLPFVAAATALGAGALSGYQAGALACLLPLMMFGAWLVSRSGLSTQQRLLRLLAIVLIIQSPIIHNGLSAGHPEGILAITLATVAVLAAMGGRARSAGLLLGLAISSKETGVIALLPVLLALPGRRREAALIAGGVVGLMCGLAWVSDPAAFLRAVHGEGATRFLTPFSLLWPLSSPLHIGTQLSVARAMPPGLTRTSATALTCLAVGSVVLGWLYLAHRRGAACRPLALLVLMGLLRCACDSTHEAYYCVALLIPMAAWEALEDHIPVKTLLLSMSVFVLYSSLGRIAPGLLYGVTTGAELLMAVYVGRRAMVMPAAGRPRARRLALGQVLRPLVARLDIGMNSWF